LKLSISKTKRDTALVSIEDL